MFFSHMQTNTHANIDIEMDSNKLIVSYFAYERDIFISTPILAP